jgi:hypothetical protein
LKLPRPYEIVAPLAVYEVLGALPRVQRRLVENFLHCLARQPGLTGDFVVPMEEGRTHQAKVVGRWLVSYWADHAVREIRVTGLELIE